jgi:hypothetical protein
LKRTAAAAQGIESPPRRFILICSAERVLKVLILAELYTVFTTLYIDPGSSSAKYKPLVVQSEQRFFFSIFD